MQLDYLLRAISTGLLQQIPLVGPVLQAILAERNQAAFEQRLVDLIHQIAGSPQPAPVVVPNDPRVVLALLMAEAEAEGRLARGATPHRRFLYLAADAYASAICTYEMAVRYSFLWRSYHNAKRAAIANVRQIAVGDVIALGYRTKGGFSMGLPLVVRGSGPRTVAVDAQQFPNRNYSPFVWANDTLSQDLRALGYGDDPVFKRQTGMNVQPLFAQAVLGGCFPSPGINAIWRHDNTHLRTAVRDWIASL